MPKSKKPRKKFHKPVMLAKADEILFGYSKEIKDKLKTWYQAIEVVAYEKLPRGIAKADEVTCLAKYINHIQVSIVSRGDIDPSCKKDVLDCLNDAALSIVALKNRCDSSQHYVCRGDELKRITEAFAMAGPYVDASIEDCPRQFVKEWAASQKMEKEINGKSFVEAYSEHYVCKRVRGI